MFGLGPTELIVIAIIVLLIFGAKRIPEIGKGLGGAIKEFRKVKDELASGGKSEETTGEKSGEEKKKDRSLEAKMTDKMLDQVPGVKKVVNAKKKADQIKEIVK